MASEKKKVRRDPAETSDGGGFDMTPMIDVTFLLIIFFMCVTEMADASKAKLVLPRAEKAEEDMPIPGRLIINVLEEGEVQVLGRNYNADELNKLLQAQRAATMVEGDDFPTQAILVRADRKTTYGDVQLVMGLCMKNKIWRIAFATKDPQAPQAQ